MQISALTGLRGMAVLLVMGYHSFNNISTGQPKLDKLFHVTNAGWIGVDLFFVLSGFLITRILMGSANSHGYFRNFYARRILRIMPLYYTVVVGAILYQLISGSTAAHHKLEALSLLLFFSNFYLAGNGWGFLLNLPLPHFWSLAVEEHFYAIYPFIVKFLTPGRLALFAGLGMGAALVARFIAYSVMHIDSVAIYMLTPLRFDALLCGCLFAVALMNQHIAKFFQRYAHVLAALALLSLFVQWEVTRFYRSPIFGSTVGYSILSLDFGILTACACSKNFWARICAWPCFQLSGRYSYALYVFNPLVLEICQRTLPMGGITGGLWAIINRSIADVLTFLLALVSWHCLEKHFLGLKERFVLSREPFDSGTVSAHKEKVGTRG